MNNVKSLLLFAIILFFSQSLFAQTMDKAVADKCRQLHGAEMEKLQSYIQSKEMPPEQALAFMQEKMDIMRQKNPECFPGYDATLVKEEEREINQLVSVKRVTKKLRTERKVKKQPGKRTPNKTVLKKKEMDEFTIAYKAQRKKCGKDMNLNLNRQVQEQKPRTGAERLMIMKKIKMENDKLVHECALEKLASKI